MVLICISPVANDVEHLCVSVFVYSRHKSFVSSGVLCKYFLPPVISLSFHLVNRVFHKQKFLILVRMQITVVFPLWILLLVLNLELFLVLSPFRRRFFQEVFPIFLSCTTWHVGILVPATSDQTHAPFAVEAQNLHH